MHVNVCVSISINKRVNEKNKDNLSSSSTNNCN